MRVVVRQVSGREGLREFVAVSFRLLGGYECWVPPLIGDEVDGLDADRNPVFRHCDACYWVAEREGGEPVGRVAAFLNPRDQERRGEGRVRFGCLDFVDDAEVLEALIAEVEAWAVERGGRLLEGPMGPSHFDRNSVLVEGFDRLPTAVSSWNPPYYGERLEALGFAKQVDYLEHRVAIAAEPDARVAKLAAYGLKKRGLRLLEIDSVKAFRPRGREVFELVNEAYAGLHDFVPLDDEEIEFLIGQFFRFLDRRFLKVVVDGDGALVAIGVAMASFSKGLQAARGRLFPFGWWRLLRAQRGNDVLDLYLVAVADAYRNAGLNAILMHAMHESALEAGMRWAETNGELETNVAVQSMWKGYDSETHKRRRIYERAIGATRA